MVVPLKFSKPGWIAKGEVPEYKLFTEEPKPKRNRRHKKYAKEALEAEAIKNEMDKKAKQNVSLEQQIMKRQNDREASSNNFFDHLLSKYGGADDSEDYVYTGKKKKNTKNSSSSSSTKKKGAKEPINKVKQGRVTKKK